MFRPAILALLLAGTTFAWKEQCESFKTSAADTTLVQATYYPEGALVNVTSTLGAVTNSSLPAFCRLQLTLITNPESGSYQNAEIWLADAWNDRLVGVGQGGWSGAINYADLAFTAVNRGFAGFSSNTGHNSTTIDASWALNNDDAIIDHAYRAYHQLVGVAKETVKQYYGREPKTTIWSGCSTAGRQGLKAVQMFEDDFDAILVGSPANWMTHLQSWSLHVGDLIRPNTSERWVSPAEWAIVNQAVFEQCDTLDGVEDDVISYPYECLKTLNLDGLSCKAKQTSGCLTPARLAAIKLVYADYYEGDEFVFKSMLPGSELAFQRLLGPTPSPLSVSFFQNMIYNDTTWNPASYNGDSFRLAESINPGRMDANNPNLNGFKKRNGKVMHYVGLADTAISPGNSRTYRNSVADYYGGNIDDFYRLFEVPGMGHCSGGLGPTGFGAPGQTNRLNPPIAYNAKYDMVSALLEWVENGKAPDQIIGASYNLDSSLNGVNFTRPLCVYPKKAHYDGGDQKKAESFSCQ